MEPLESAIANDIIQFATAAGLDGAQPLPHISIQKAGELWSNIPAPHLVPLEEAIRDDDPNSRLPNLVTAAIWEKVRPDFCQTIEKDLLRYAFNRTPPLYASQIVSPKTVCDEFELTARHIAAIFFQGVTALTDEIRRRWAEAHETAKAASTPTLHSAMFASAPRVYVEKKASIRGIHFMLTAAGVFSPDPIAPLAP